MGALRVLVVVMGVLLVGGTVTLVALLVQRAGGSAGGGAAMAVALAQPEGARIAGIAQAAEGVIAVWVRRDDGDRVLLVDTRRGAAAGEIRLGP